jgi:hypothetical protein
MFNLKINYIDMNKVKIVVMLFFVMIHCDILFAVNAPDKTIELEKRISYLEEYKSNIDNLSKIEIQNAKDEIKKELDSKYEDVENLLKLILILGIPTTLWGFYMTIWGIKRKVQKLIDDKIETIVEQKREEIIKLVSNQEFETSLKNTKKIIVISPTEDAQDEVKKTMSNFKFKHLIYRINNTTGTIPEHDLIIFNNIDGEFSQTEIDSIMSEESDEDVCFVAYTSKNLDRNPRLNFANSKFTLYHSILSTLSFVESIRKED